MPNAFDLDAALIRILDLAIEATDADFGTIQVCGADGSLRIAGQRGFQPDFLEFFRIVKHDKSACSVVLQDRRRVVVRDVRRSPHFTEAARRVMLDAGVVASQSTPILSPARDISGVVSTHFRTPHVPEAGELDVVDVLAMEAGLIIKASQASLRRAEMTRVLSELKDSVAYKTRVIRGNRAKQ